jgi:NADH-quinone oxidoreductase subunit C
MSDAPEIDPPAVPEPEMLYGVPMLSSGIQVVLFPSVDKYRNTVATLAEDGYHMCIDLCVVDYLTYMDRSLPIGVVGERFEVVVNLLDLEGRRRIRLRVQVGEAEPIIPTLTELHPGTEAMEREGYDMFGLTFDGHPDPTRILMPEDWEGHPLRKDYAIGRIPVQFKAPEGR